jgi:hypothetical protein
MSWRRSTDSSWRRRFPSCANRGCCHAAMAERPRLDSARDCRTAWVHAGGVDPFDCPIQDVGRARFRWRYPTHSAWCRVKRRQAGFDSSVVSDGCRLNKPVIPGRSPKDSTFPKDGIAPFPDPTFGDSVLSRHLRARVFRIGATRFVPLLD